MPSPLRPDRRHVFPFLVVGFPTLWFVYRETPVRIVDGRRVTTPLPRTLALAAVALAASYVVAVLVASTIGRRENGGSWRGLLLAPTDGTLVALLALWAVLVGYVALDATVDLPSRAELVVVPLLWPLLVAILATHVLGDAVPALRAFEVRAAFAVVGLAASAAWTFLLSTAIARALSGPLTRRRG